MMTEELARLWAIRELDEQIATLKSALARFPHQRRDLEQRIKIEQTRLEEIRASTAAVQLKRRQREKDIDAASAEERKFQSQLPAVKKNEEYTALLHEIEGAKRRRSEIETEVLLGFEEEEQIQKQRPAIEQALKEAQREAVERGAAIDREEGTDREQLVALEARRSELLALVTGPVRSRYDRVHSSRDGRAIVPILKDACGGCFRNQPPQLLQEARRGDRVFNCEGCGRMLIWPPEGS